jgi:ribose/xylose/arabinose/galactoside ABC-type transport system permease subunit
MNTRVFNSNLIYDVILVVVLGGIGLSGGRGGAPNVVVGTLHATATTRPSRTSGSCWFPCSWVSI